MTQKKVFMNDSVEDDTLEVRQLMLIPGKWKSFLTEYEYKTMVASALNTCVVEHGLIIFGYLITFEKIYLVVETSKDSAFSITRDFLIAFRITLIRHFAALAKKGVPFLPSMKIFTTSDEATLFEDYFFDDPILSQLLVNKNTELPYYDPQLKKIQEWLLNCDFCSYNKHADEIGSVITHMAGIKKM